MRVQHAWKQGHPPLRPLIARHISKLSAGLVHAVILNGESKPVTVCFEICYGPPREPEWKGSIDTRGSKLIDVETSTSRSSSAREEEFFQKWNDSLFLAQPVIALRYWAGTVARSIVEIDRGDFDREYDSKRKRQGGKKSD